MNSYYDKKVLLNSLFGLLIMMGLMKATGGWGFAVIVPLSLYAMITNNIRALFYWLLVSNCMLMGNHTLMPKDLVFAFCQRGMMVILGCCLMAKAAGGRTPRQLSPIFSIFAYITYMILPSLFGWAPMVSILKLILFVTVFFAYIGTAKQCLGMSPCELPKIRATILATACFFLIGSVVLIPFTSLSYMSAEELLRNPDIVSLFKGMTWHSQTLGPLVATLFVFLMGDLLFNIRKPDKLYIVLILICPFLVYKTSSRTGMGTMLAGLMFLALMFINARNIRSNWKSRVASWLLAICVVGSAATAMVPSVRLRVVQFILKQEKSSVTYDTEIESETVLSTRQFLMDEAMYNWQQSPVIGNGFQVSRNMVGAKRDSLMSYLSAPIEKGVWVTAILEEGGVIGMILFVMFWLPTTIVLWKREVYVAAGLLLANVVCNLAEFCMFSMSSEGGFVWGVFFAAVIVDGFRIKMQRDYI